MDMNEYVRYGIWQGRPEVLKVVIRMIGVVSGAVGISEGVLDEGMHGPAAAHGTRSTIAWPDLVYEVCTVSYVLYVCTVGYLEGRGLLSLLNLFMVARQGPLRQTPTSPNLQDLPWLTCLLEILTTFLISLLLRTTTSPQTSILHADLPATSTLLSLSPSSPCTLSVS
jgi:hypothetical protein